MSHAYRLLDDETGLIQHLESLLEKTPYTSVIILLAETLRRHHAMPMPRLSWWPGSSTANPAWVPSTT